MEINAKNSWGLLGHVGAFDFFQMKHAIIPLGGIGQSCLFFSVRKREGERSVDIFLLLSLDSHVNCSPPPFFSSFSVLALYASELRFDRPHARREEMKMDGIFFSVYLFPNSYFSVSFFFLNYLCLLQHTSSPLPRIFLHLFLFPG